MHNRKLLRSWSKRNKNKQRTWVARAMKGIPVVRNRDTHTTPSISFMASLRDIYPFRGKKFTRKDRDIKKKRQNRQLPRGHGGSERNRTCSATKFAGPESNLYRTIILDINESLQHVRKSSGPRRWICVSHVRWRKSWDDQTIWVKRSTFAYSLDTLAFEPTLRWLM